MGTSFIFSLKNLHMMKWVFNSFHAKLQSGVYIWIFLSSVSVCQLGCCPHKNYSIITHHYPCYLPTEGNIIWLSLPIHKALLQEKWRQLTASEWKSTYPRWLQTHRHNQLVKGRDGISVIRYIQYFLNIGYQYRMAFSRYRFRLPDMKFQISAESKYRISVKISRYAIPSERFH